MGFTKVRQSAGECSIDLRGDLPYSISQALAMPVAGFSHLVVTPTRLPLDQIDWTSLRALSIYTGVLRRRTSRTKLSGAHATVWLGDEDKKGNIESAVTATTTFQAWVDYLRKGSTAAGVPALDAGSVEALGGSWTATWNWGSDSISRRDQLIELCGWAGAEFRVNDDLTLDAGQASYLYGANPTVVLTPTWEGRDGGFVALRATFTPDEDVEDWSSDVIYAYSGGAAAIAGTRSFKNGLGNDALWARKLDLDASKSNALLAPVATRELSRFQSVRQTLRVDTDDDVAMMSVNPGDRVYAYAPDLDVYDMSAAPVYFRGELIHPVKLAVDSVTMPASSGLGIYFRRGDGLLIDLSEWYLPETGNASLVVGNRPQPLRAALRSRGILDRN